jgi:HD-like signal output (HDOD) protein
VADDANVLRGITMSELGYVASEPTADLRSRLVTALRDVLIDHAVSLPLGNQHALVYVGALCEQGEATRYEIAEAAAGDEGFSATLLRLANSAALGGVTQIADLPSAVTRLGTRMVGTLAVAMPVMRLLAVPDDGMGAARKELHRHATRVGVLARDLAPRQIHPETALAAGLIHNVGLGVLSISAPVGFARVLRTAEAAADMARAETDVFGFTHAALGALMGKAWAYPDELLSAIEEHDAPAPSTRLAALVQVADLLVREAGIGIEPGGTVDPAVAAIAGIDLGEARARAGFLLGYRPDDGDVEPSEADIASARLIDSLDGLRLA